MIEKRSEPRTRAHLCALSLGPIAPSGLSCERPLLRRSAAVARLYSRHTRGVRTPYPLARRGLSGVRHMALAPRVWCQVPLTQCARGRLSATPIELPCRGAAFGGLKSTRDMSLTEVNRRCRDWKRSFVKRACEPVQPHVRSCRSSSSDVTCPPAKGSHRKASSEQKEPRPGVVRPDGVPAG
jgi:hypothetical protein